MGQAKRRGTFEERKAAAITRHNLALPMDRRPVVIGPTPRDARLFLAASAALALMGDQLYRVTRPGEVGTHVSHFATCPHAKSHRR